MKFLQRRSKSQRIVFVIFYIIFLIYAGMLLYPFVFSLMLATKESAIVFTQDFNANKLATFNSFNLKNFILAFQGLKVNNVTYIEMFFNSLWFAVGGTLIGLFSSSCSAYIVCKYKFKGRKIFYTLSLIVLIVPIVGALPAQYRLFSNIGMKNSPLIILAYSGGFGYNFLILYSYFKNLSWSYAESAFVDGAGHFTVFFKIMMPQCVAPLVAIGVLAFIGMWNDYMTPYLYLNELPTLSSGMYIYEENMKYEANQPVYFAGVLLSIIPVVLLFGLFQNSVMEKVHTGGLKG